MLVISLLISASVGFGFCLSSATAAMICPDWQYPHCGTSSSIQASWTGCVPSADSPSMVVTALPATADAGMLHERVAWPSIRTVQAPHWAMPQPYLVPVSFKESRSTHSNGVSGSTSAVCAIPLTIREIDISLPPMLRARAARSAGPAAPDGAGRSYDANTARSSQSACLPTALGLPQKRISARPAGSSWTDSTSANADYKIGRAAGRGAKTLEWLWNDVDIGAERIDLGRAGWLFTRKRGGSDVDRIAIAREAAEDRGAVRGRRNRGRASGRGGGSGAGAGAPGRARPARSGDRDAVLDARPMVAPSVPRSVSPVWIAAVPLSSATAQHGDGARTEAVH